MWFKKLFSSSNEASSKRFILVILVFAYVVSHYLTMYIPVEIKNKELVASSEDGLFWLILFFGGYVTSELLIKKLSGSGASKVIADKVQEMTVNVEKKE